MPTYAAESRFGSTIAPQSFTAVCAAGHGMRPATVGRIPDSHTFIAPGRPDQRRSDGVRLPSRADPFLWRAIIQRGDNHYVNQRGERIALQRASAIRFRPEAGRAAAGDAGWTDEMSVDRELAAWDPEFSDGAYYGPSRGHVSSGFARRLGVPRAYGYGASLGAWIIDYLSSWGGEWGFVDRTKSQYRNPVLIGDVAYLRGSVVGKSDALDAQLGKMQIDYVVTNQRDETLAKGTGDVLLPRD